MNIFFLIGHAGSGKSFYGKSVKKYMDSSKYSMIYYDEDEQVASIAGYNSFEELLDNERNIQHYYAKFMDSLRVEADSKKNIVFVVSTGGYSVLIDDLLYKNGYKIYIKSSLEDILKSIQERSTRGISSSIVQGFDKVPKQLEFKEFETNLFHEYFHKADEFYIDMMNLLIENKHTDKEAFETNNKKIADYIISR